LNRLKPPFIPAPIRWFPEQSQVIKDLTAQVEKLISDTASKVAGEAGSALKDVPKTLPK
jgi:hypothetical protein